MLQIDRFFCPIRSPLGYLTNDSKANHDFHNDITIGWKDTDPTPPTCAPKLVVFGSNGEIMEHANGNVRLLDR